METGRGRGNEREGGRGRGGRVWRGPYKGKGDRGNRKNNFEQGNTMHTSNVTGPNPFLYPNQNAGVAGSSNQVPSYGGLPLGTREPDEPFIGNFRTDHQNPNQNIPYGGGQERGAKRRPNRQSYTRPQQHSLPSYPLQFPPPQNQPQEPSNSQYQRHNVFHPSTEFQKGFNVPRESYSQNSPQRHLEGSLKSNQSKGFQGPPNPFNPPETHFRREEGFIINDRSRQLQQNYDMNQDYLRFNPNMSTVPIQQHEQGPSVIYQRYSPNMPTTSRQQQDQGPLAKNPNGFGISRESLGKSETDLYRIKSVESLNSEKSLKLNIQNPNSHEKSKRRKNPKKNKNKHQNDLTSNAPDIDLNMSCSSRPLSRSSSNSYDMFNDAENLVLPKGSDVNKQTQNFRGRGRARVRGRGSNIGTGGDERLLSRNSSLNNDRSHDFVNLNLQRGSGLATKNLSNRHKNVRGRGKGCGSYPGADLNDGDVSKPLSRRSSCSSDQDNGVGVQELNTYSNVIKSENQQTENVHSVNSGSGNHRGQRNLKQTKGKRNNKFQSNTDQQKSNITVEQLETLKKREPMEIVQILSQDGNEYSSLLQEDFDLKVFISVLDILCNICETSPSQPRAEILRQVSLPAFTSQLFNCVTEYPYVEDDALLQYVNQFFENTILLYETLLDFMPSAIRMWHNHIVEVQKALQTMSKNPRIELNCNILNKVKDLLDEVGQSLKNEVKEEKVQIHEKKKETYTPELVGNFRTVSLYPRPEDVFSEQPFLFPNIIKGPYRSVDHYLDIHFKLLREDFMSPIRQAMRDYKKQCNTKDRFKRVENVRIYRKVKFLSPKTVMDTVGYEVCFDVDKKLNRVNWEFSNRFMYGSLLLFTDDNFDSFFMATVASRNVKELENKLVTVELVEHLENGKSILGKEFIMAESEAYFNPYFHVLKALQRFNETNFPLAQYIVHVNTETKPPRYLSFAEIYSINMADNNFTFRVLSDIEWPTHEQVGLDPSQYGAFRAALTNDLTVVQGPPGTGKTFLGLKIAQALLENSRVWNQTSTPIFVVCFTNHALDQFLEGLLPVTTKLVRIGGKSKGGELDKFNIRERRKEYSYYKKVQGREIRDLKQKMSTVFADIKVYQSNLKALEDTTGIISVRTLQFVMSDEQRDYFRGDDDLMDWLLEGVGGVKSKEKVKITITADRGVVREAPKVDPIIADAEDLRVKQAFFDTIDLDTTVGPSEDTVTVQFACDLNSIEKKKEELRQQLSGKHKLHKNQLLQTRETYDSFDKILLHLRKELLESKKYPRSDSEKENLRQKIYLRELQPNDRWRLYHTWVNILRDGLIVTLGTKDDLYKEYSFRYDQLRQNDDLQILKTANVVGTTTTLAAKFQPMFEALAPRIVIVEEAAEVLEAHIIASLSQSCEHLILIGDHKQLRPSVAESRMGRQYQLDVSLFERLVINDMACHTLTLQHRMRPEISQQLVPTIYPQLLDDPCVKGREDIRGMDKNVFFMTHNNFEDEVTEITSKRNQFEAEILLGLARYLVQQGYKPQDITILATYKGQMYHMKNEIKNMSGFPRGIQITVVDNFQGEENKIILLSLVRSNAVKKIGFLEIENRICVALSRARDGLYIVGNMDCLVANTEIWAKIRNSLARQNSYGPALNLRCQIHKDQKTKIESAKDFSKVSEGGCSLLCGQPLPCGHSCKSMCHVEQDYHQRYKCKEPCSKMLCAEGHQCPKKCHQQCGQCQIPMRRQLECGHFADVPCYLDIREHACTESVQVVVPFCRHTVTIPCHTRFHPECNLPCTKRLECGHSCELQCHEMDDPDHLDYACMKPCARFNKNCSLNHKCSMACFEDCKPCLEKVLSQLPCGHSLKLPCSTDLSTVVCKQKCDKTMECGHPCTKKCFQQCEPCLVPVQKKVMGCGHMIEVACGTMATRQNCTGRCPNTLGCGHQCGKRCMDICSPRDCEQPVVVKREKSLLSIFTSQSKQFLLCGHSAAHVPCNKVHQVERMKPEELMQYCCEPCGKELTCKHVCGGTCSQCMQGRIHKVCNEQCGNVLICGHSCKVPCRDVCPPCQEPCRHECKHSKCNRKCGEECVPCKEPCDYACQHLKCTRLCGELCDRKPCPEPCPQRLSCGHSCVGFCGEPCPPCRQCEPQHFEAIFYLGEETEDDAKWVRLVDCGHTCESTGLETWLKMKQESGEIGCKVCPRCKTPIVKVQRFMNLIKQTYLDIQNVKAQCFGKRDEIRKERAQALMKIQNVKFTYMPSVNEPDDELETMYNELKAELPEIKAKKRNTIGTQKLRLLCFWTEFFLSVYTRKQEVWPRLDEESKSLLNSKINFLTKLLMKRDQKITEQEMQGFECEVKRIHRIIDLLVYTSSPEYRMASSYSGAKDTRLAVESVILSVSAYDDELDSRVKALLGKLKEQIRSSTQLSAEEKSMINKAMSSSFRSAQKTGHWFKCKNGHLYCITECGGAMEEAQCPVRGCGVKIGGQDHRLLDDQTLASEMDGARHAAWSDANNMANFGIF